MANRGRTVAHRGQPGQTGVNRLALPVVLKCLIEPGRTGTSVKNRGDTGANRISTGANRGDTVINRAKPGRLFYPGSTRCWAGIATVYAGGATV